MRDAVGHIKTTTGAPGTIISETGLGFDPTVLLVWWSGRTEVVDAVSRATRFNGFGWAAGPEARRCMAWRSLDSVTTTNAGKKSFKTALVAVLGSDFVEVGALDFNQFVPGGFELIVDNDMPADLTIHYKALDCANVELADFKLPFVGGNFQTLTTFTPKGLFLLNTGSPAAHPQAGTAGDNGSFGVCTASGAEGFVGVNSQNALPTSDVNSVNHHGVETLGQVNASAGIIGRVAFVSFDSGPSGFTLDETEAGVNEIFCLALSDPDDFEVFQFVTRVNTTPFDVALGFKPAGAMFFSNGRPNNPVDVGAPGNIQTISVGAVGDNDNQRTASFAELDNQAISDVDTGISFDTVYHRLSQSSDTEITGCAFISRAALKMTLQMGPAETAAQQVFGMAFGPFEEPSPPPPDPLATPTTDGGAVILLDPNVDGLQAQIARIRGGLELSAMILNVGSQTALVSVLRSNYNPSEFPIASWPPGTPADVSLAPGGALVFSGLPLGAHIFYAVLGKSAAAGLPTLLRARIIHPLKH